MGKLLLKTNIIREPGFLYYCGTDSSGKLTVCEAKMHRKGKSKKRKK